MFSTFPDLCVWLVWSKSKYFILTQPRVALQLPSSAMSSVGLGQGPGGAPAWLGRSCWHPVRVWNSLYPYNTHPKWGTHLSYKKWKFLPWFDWGRPGKNLNSTFQLLVPESISTSAAAAGRVSRVALGSQPRKSWQISLGFLFFFFGLPKLAKPAKN